MIALAIWLAAIGYWVADLRDRIVGLPDPVASAAMMVTVMLPFCALVRWLWK